MEAGRSDRIELLEVGILDRCRERVEEFYRLTAKLSIELGWHYPLDLAWITAHMESLHQSRILDAGAGTGALQWWLADQGAEVISVDRLKRADLSTIFRVSYRVEGLRPIDYQPFPELILRRVSGKAYGRPDLLGGFRASAGWLISLFTPKAPGKVILYNHDLGTMPDLQDESVDAVVSVSSLEHNEPGGLKVVVQELLRVLKVGGTLLATLGAAKERDWLHEPSGGWCYTEKTLREVFELPEGVSSNYDRYDELMERLRHSEELKDRLAPFYSTTGNSGMPYGVWDPQYQPVGVFKTKGQR